MRLYHGTNTEFLPEIRKHGLKDPCLTSDYEIACEYADVAVGNGFPCVVAVDVEPSQLRVDWRSVEEPVGNGEYTGKQMDRRVRQMYAKMQAAHPEWVDDELGIINIPDELYQASLDSVFTARAAGRVPITGVVSTAEHRDGEQYGLFESTGSAKAVRDQLVHLVAQRLRDERTQYFQKIDVTENESEEEDDEPSSWSVFHPDAKESWVVYRDGNKWTAEGNGSYTYGATCEEAIEAAKREIGYELNRQRGTFGNDFRAQAATAPLFEHFDWPASCEIVKDWFQTKWGSWYAEVRLEPRTEDDEGSELLKLSIRDHEPVRKDMGVVTRYYEVSREWTPQEVAEALDRMEAWVHRKAGLGGRDVQESAASLIERYAGSDQERGIWYHGTSSKLLPSILSQGLIPDPKQRAWDKDTDVSSTSVSLASYGGIYLTKNLLTAVSSSRRVYLRDKANPLIVICALQPRSLIADEDSFTNVLKGRGHTYGLLWHYKEFIAPGKDTERAGYLEDVREKWATDYTTYLAPKAHPELRKRVHALLRGEGYEAMVTRTVSHHLKEGGYSSKHDWEREWPREMQDAGTVPALPAPEEGELVFRRFIDKLTRVLKGVARGTTDSFMKTARTEQPIRFNGSNRIIAVVELKGYTGKHGDEGHYDVTVHYGTVPDDFIAQYAERFTKDFKVVQARERGRERAIAEAVQHLIGGSVFTA